MVGAARFELATARTPSVCATRLRYAPILGKEGQSLAGFAEIVMDDLPGGSLARLADSRFFN